MSVCSTLTTLSENYASSALISFSAATTTNSSNSFQISFPIIHLAHPTLLTHLTHVQYITLPYSSPIRILNSSPILGSITASLAIQHPLPRTPNDPSACQAQDLDCLVIWKHWLFFFGELSQAWCFFFHFIHYWENNDNIHRWKHHWVGPLFHHPYEYYESGYAKWIIHILYWLVVWNMNFIFPSIGNFIIPTDFHMFQRGRSTTNQYMFDLFVFFGLIVFLNHSWRLKMRPSFRNISGYAILANHDLQAIGNFLWFLGPVSQIEI